jgi:hypothetical protein
LVTGRREMVGHENLSHAVGILGAHQRPVSGEMRNVTMPSGIGRFSCGTPFNASRMKWIQIGSAVCAPSSLLAQGALLVEANPDGGDQVGRKAVEPGVDAFVGGAGLARDVGAVQRQGPHPVPCLMTSAIMSVMM